MPAIAHVSDSLYKAARTRNIKWTKALGEAIEQLKCSLLERPVVRIQDPHRDFVLETDASIIAVGFVLKQQFSDTQLEHPVWFFSRALSDTERNYSVYELEMYAVVRAAEHFQVLLLGRQFLLRTDHMALINMLRRDLPPTTRVRRWILRLSEYVFKITYYRGRANLIADVLSRLPFACGAEEATPRAAGIPGVTVCPLVRQTPLEIAMTANEPESDWDSDSLVSDDGSRDASDNDSDPESLWGLRKGAMVLVAPTALHNPVGDISLDEANDLQPPDGASTRGAYQALLEDCSEISQPALEVPIARE